MRGAIWLRTGMLLAWWPLAAGAAAPTHVQAVRVWESPEYTRAVFDLGGVVEYKLFTLDNPERVVLDLQGAALAPGYATPGPRGRVRGLRSGQPTDGALRVVIDVAPGTRPKSFLLPPVGNKNHLLARGDGAVLPAEHCAPAGEPAERKAGAASGAAAGTKKPSTKAKAPAEGGGHAHVTHGDGKALTVYADGACSGNPGPAGLGVVIYDEHEKRELSEFLGRATNNIAELTANLRAAEALVGEERPIVLKTDSQYSIGVLTKGCKAKATPELIAQTKAALAKVPTLKLRYVEGHAGHAGNERADELARVAVEAKRSSGWKVHAKV